MKSTIEKKATDVISEIGSTSLNINSKLKIKLKIKELKEKKMKKSKHVLIVVLTVALIMTCLPSSVALAAAKQTKVTVSVDGVKMNPAVKPVAIGKTVFVPREVFADGLGAKVKYKNKKLTITMTANKFVFKIGSKNYTFNGTKKSLKKAPKMINKKPMFPLNAVIKDLGGKCTISGKTCKATYFSAVSGSIVITGSTTIQPIAQAAADKLRAKNKNLSITVAGGGSGTGIKDTIAGKNNLGMSSRDLEPSEKSKIQALRIARDGIAIIVHPKNNVKKLTSTQARKIFLGEIKNWSEVGGANAPIVVFTREVGSGTRTTLEELLLDKKSVVKKATPKSSSKLIKQAVAGNKNAIGYDSIGFVDSTVKALALDKVKPTVATVKNKEYLMSRSLYMLSKGAPKGASAVFIDYLNTLDVQRNIIAVEGYISLK